MLPVNRLLVLALDMADGDLIRHWSGQGRLPHFASLISSGTWIDLESHRPGSAYFDLADLRYGCPAG